MNAPPNECPRCRGTLETGFLLDVTHGTYQRVRWVEGPIVRSFWGGIKIGGRRKLDVIAYRCTRCDHLVLGTREKQN
jgi:hypothetical protein